MGEITWPSVVLLGEGFLEQNSKYLGTPQYADEYTSRQLGVSYARILMKAFWAQLFLLPKKLIRRVETICRSYLWTGSETSSPKAQIAWEQVCLPKIYGGWNKDMI